MAILGNIYENKHYKLYILVPIALLLISLYFIPKIQLDSTLKGGVSVQVQTNSTLDPRTITSLVNQKIPNAQASVSASPGGLSITMAENTSLAAAQVDLLDFYSAYSNYTSSTLNLTSYQAEITSQPQNASTLQPLLAASQKEQAQSIAAFSTALSSELTALKPFGIQENYTPSQYNASSYASLSNIANGAYSNASLIYQNQVIAKLRTVLPFSSYSYNEVTPTLGAYFLNQMVLILVVAFILVAIVVFVIFRTPVPSFAVVFGAANDLIVALGAMGLFGIPLGVASIGGLLMLVGFSMDTDILSAIRIIKRNDGTAEQRAWSSLKTGVTMTTTAVLAFSVLFIASYFAFIPTYLEISGVVLVGLVADVITTWMTDVPLVLWYKKSKEVHSK
jgi:preprotein translocase subunit SecF